MCRKTCLVHQKTGRYDLAQPWLVCCVKITKDLAVRGCVLCKDHRSLQAATYYEPWLVCCMNTTEDRGRTAGTDVLRALASVLCKDHKDRGCELLRTLACAML